MGRCSEKKLLHAWGRKLKENLQVKEPRRLAKIPKGYVVVGDKGFSEVSEFYPNYNNSIHPHFINKRKQFPKEEVEQDFSLCRLRYVSEAHFSRLTRFDSISGTVRQEYKTHLQNIVWWASGMANLCQPYTYCSNYEAYKKSLITKNS